MKVYFGSDHHGVEVRRDLMSYVTKLGYKCEDVGMNIDFPLIAQEVARRVLENRSNRGILICENGHGMAMAANKYSKDIRSAACCTVMDAKQTREQDNINILALGADCVELPPYKEIVEAFLTTKFTRKTRYRRRLEQMKNTEQYQ
jgi:RpiB/LacA/LacB family sugar-phosphate isomerase